MFSKILLTVLSFYVYQILVNSQYVAQLPYCNKKVQHKELVLVSTLDGVLTALSNDGTLSWQIETGPGPLLSSNIHQLELTNNGQWVRIIPSLSGGLYKFDGITIDAIPISAESLLTSSFRYADDILIAGGQEVRTYGVMLDSGKQLYECSLDGCKNTTEYSEEGEFGDILIIERKTHTVRAVEPRTGMERWNFSVGHHNVKVPYITCVNMNLKNSNFNISAVLPDGLLIANSIGKFSEELWRYKFDVPIVAVWKWNGRELLPLNLFSTPVTNSKTNEPSIYLGMHNKQLYIYESVKMQELMQLKQRNDDKHSESKSLTQIPWNPLPASGMVDESDDSTAISVLYGSDYVNGNGYYLYTQEEKTCEHNFTNNIGIGRIKTSKIWFWWKEVLFFTLCTIIACNLFYTYTSVGTTNMSKDTPSTGSSGETLTYDRLRSSSESLDTIFVSKYTSEFDHISCLGKGGFGVVFQARKKFDECDYAVKRIQLPNNSSAKQRMMREVKVLAKLDHRNIVRYYNAWLEYPPGDWQREYDRELLSDISMSYTEKSLNASKLNSSVAIKLEPSSSGKSSSLSIVFERDSQDLNSLPSNEADSIAPCDTTSPPIYLYIQMQLCCKESLKDWLNSNPNRNNKPIILDIFQQIVDAVEYVHLQGLIHRDLKPSNIFFSLDGQVKVGDFGLVTKLNDYNSEDESECDSKKSYTNAVGTHLYMSPEQVDCRQYDFKVDIYSLGIIFFELLVPFQTEMERITILTDLRNHVYPEDFATSFKQHVKLVKSMLSINPAMRPMASEILNKLSA